MPRRKPKPHELTTEQMLRRLFPKEARETVRKEARKAADKQGKKNTRKQSK
jgi:hypothetical protein